VVLELEWTSTRSRLGVLPRRTNDSDRIYVLKREIAEVARAVMPLARADAQFADGRVPASSATPAVLPRRRSTTSPGAEIVDSLDALLSTAFDAHLARIRCSRTTTCGRSRPGARWSSCRR
jgi:magnesium transporter